ncbi:MAG: DUF1501 domain-containing protein [Acidobacteriota bacterium]|nr:DUF1501 domain-containing protein [Acidobacteriota bacterium]
MERFDIDAMKRRAFLGQGVTGLGLVALNSLLGPGLLRAEGNAAATVGGNSLGAVNPLPFAPKAKRVIYLYQAGGPSHLETFDFKPALAKLDGQAMPESFTKGQQLAQLQGKQLKCFGPRFGFKRFGKGGLEICELFPEIGSVADELCIVRSVWSEQINHDTAHMFMNTGSIIAGRPSMGSWLFYGLGSESQDLPGFIVMLSEGRGGQMQPVSARQWSSGFLPSKFQGIKLNSFGDPVLYIDNPPGMDRPLQHASIETVAELDRKRYKTVQDPEILTRISQYEMAFRMQRSVPDLVDMSKEPAHVLEAYGAKPGDGSYASNCLLARRLAERGVRFIQLYHRDWDHHEQVKNGIEYKAQEVDKPTGALIKDLKERGMLDDTLIIFGGEFGRTPMSQSGTGRDHHIKTFSYVLAGGGFKRGITYGASDELGYAAVENPVSIHDLHATILRSLGIDHRRMTVKYQGLDARLSGVGNQGQIVTDLLA